MQVTAEELAGLSEEDRKLLEDDATPEPEVVAEPEAEVAEVETEGGEVEGAEQPAEPTELDKLREQIDNLNKALKQERYQSRVLSQNAEEIKRQILEMREKKKEAPQAPEFDDDPLEHTKGKLTEFTASQEETKRKLEQMEAMQRQQQYALHVANLENAFKATTPDYDAAFKHMVEFRKKELSNYGLEDDGEIERVIQADCFKLTSTALQNGKNPAQVLYETAKMYGYKPAEAKKTDQPIPTLGDVAKGQAKASQTLSKGGKDDTTLNIESLLDTSGEDFDAKWNTFFGKKKASLL